MNKKNLLILSGLLISLLLIYFLLIKKPWSTNKLNSSEVSFEKIETIDKIFMADKYGAKVLLEKQADGKWLVNGKVEADEQKLKLLLSTIHEMKMQRPVDGPLHNTVIGDLASRGIKTEIYSNNDLQKTFYIGSETPDKTGTYYYEENAAAPLIVHIPGFVGFLTPRFFLDEVKWQSKLIFNSEANEIASVRVEYPGKPDKSFLIKSGKLFDLNQKELIANPQIMKIYLSSFKGLFVEGYLDYITKEQTDSILKMQPFCKLELELTNGTKTTMDVFEKKIGKKTMQLYSENNEALEIDPEKFFAWINHKPQLASIQVFSFGKLFVGRQQLQAQPE
ncbi:MAG: DUF4340 domain-containing protein [Bacteroidia bacterium]